MRFSLVTEPKAARRQSRSLPKGAGLVLALVCALGCGGGGGGSGSGDSATNSDPPPIETNPVTPPTEEGRSTSTARVVVRNGDSSLEGFVVGNIEDAALDDRGSLALIAKATRGDEQAILRSTSEGALETIIGAERNPNEIDLASLARLRMAPSGELAFRSGAGLDSDQLHLVSEGQVQTIAGSSGAVAPGFRVLGNFRIGQGGQVAFVGGGGDCESETSGDSVRDLCTVSLFIADDSGVTRVVHPDFELDRRQAKDAQMVVGQGGEVFFSVPARGSSPILIRFDGEEVEALLQKKDDLLDLGVLAQLDLVDADEEGRILVELGVEPENEDDPVDDRIGLFVDDRFVQFASEGLREEDQTIFALRAIGLGGGKALFEATLRQAETSEETKCLRLGDETSTIDIACVGRPFPGEEKTVFSIAGARINAAGDVLFLSSLGSTSGDLRRVEENRATVRRSNGELVTIASSADAARLGTISELTSVGFNDAGEALLIAERGRSSDRVLLLGGSR